MRFMKLTQALTDTTDLNIGSLLIMLTLWIAYIL